MGHPFLGHLPSSELNIQEADQEVAAVAAEALVGAEILADHEEVEEEVLVVADEEGSAAVVVAAEDPMEEDLEVEEVTVVEVVHVIVVVHVAVDVLTIVTQEADPIMAKEVAHTPITEAEVH